MATNQPPRIMTAARTAQNATAPEPTAAEINLVFEFHLREAHRLAFRNQYFKGKTLDQVWRVVGEILRQSPRNIARWVNNETKNNGIVRRPTLDDLCQYVVEAEREGISYPAGPVIANRAIQATLMAIGKRMPGRERQEITEAEVAYLRFYAGHLDCNPLPGRLRASEPQMKDVLRFAYEGGETTEQIVADMESVYCRWAPVWRILTKALTKYPWITHSAT